MFEVSAEITILIRIAFWILAAVALFTRGRVRLLSYLALTQLSVFANQAGTNTGVDFENATKALLLPILFAAQEGPWPSLTPIWKKLGALWIVLICYATIAVGWSPYKVAGLKMVCYLIGDAALFLYFTKKWQEGIMDRSVILISLWTGLGIAFFQSYVLTNPYGTEQLSEFAARFTSFASAQTFAVFLLIYAALLFVFPERDRAFWLSLGAATLAILMTGSRYIFLSLCLLVPWILLVTAFKGTEFRARYVFGFRSMFGLISLLILLFAARELPNNRLQELLGSRSGTPDTHEEVSNLAVRLAIYQDAWERLQDSSTQSLVMGKGTSSGGQVISDVLIQFDDSNVDANRAIHNEVIRSIYEWGIPGFLSLAAVCLGLTWKCLSVGWRFRPAALIPCVGLLPGLWLSLVVENILSNPGGPAGTSIAMFLGFVAMGDLASRGSHAIGRPMP